jgi:hypothetical protein
MPHFCKEGATKTYFAEEINLFRCGTRGGGLISELIIEYMLITLVLLGMYL